MTAFRVSRWPILSTITLLLLSLVGYVEGQGKGYHSDHFDPKYFLPRENLITPITHPGLFTFDGRWTLRHSSFQASTWQGNSFTVLLFGTKCNLQLRPIPQGKIPAYTFYIQVDGGPLRGMQIDGFDTSAPEHAVMQVAIDLGVSDPPGALLTPHTVRFVSIPETPIRFEGIWMENTMVKQGYEWLSSQNNIQTVEFIGDDIDVLVGRSITPISGEKTFRSSASALANSAQWRASESLGIRHAHIDSGICLSSNCNPSNPLPGLAEQYFNFSPLNNSLPFTRSHTVANTDKNHYKNFEIPWHFRSHLPGHVFTKAPDALVVDVGLLDTVVHRVKVDEFEHNLLLFLARVLNQGYQDRRIVVLTRPSGGMSRDNILIPQNSETRSIQEALHTATLSAVKKLQNADPQGAGKFLTVHTVNPGNNNPVLDLEKALCRTVIPPPPSSYLPSFVTNAANDVVGTTILGTGSELSKAQKRCRELGSLRARVNIVDEYSGGDILWTLAFLILAVMALWVARDTILGACSFIVTGGKGMVRNQGLEGGEGYRKLG